MAAPSKSTGTSDAFAGDGQEKLVRLWDALMATLRKNLQQPRYVGAKLEEILPQEFMLTIGNGILSVWLDVYSGRGSWNCISQQSGPGFDMAEPWSSFLPNEISLDGEKMDIGKAAERFISKTTGEWQPH